MVTSSRDSTTLLMQLCKNSEKFDFFQAVRLLELAAVGFESGDECLISKPVGYNYMSNEEVIRFYGLTSFSFPISPISKISCIKNAYKTKNSNDFKLRFNMIVTFIGLTGSNGVLPNHYSELLIKNLRSKDNCLKEFIDIFNHRTISLFYRAWKKYRIFANYEQISHVLSCLAGIGAINKNNYLSVSKESLIFYSGLYHQPRSANALEAILNDYFLSPIHVKQFQVETIFLTKCEQTRISALENNIFYNRLGSNAVLGNKIHDLNSVYKEGVGIFVQMSGYNIISNNAIFNTTYTGISVGWRWNTEDTSCKENIIEG